MATVQDLDVDSIITRLLEVRGSRPGKTVQLTEQEIKGLCLKSRENFHGSTYFIGIRSSN